MAFFEDGSPCTYFFIRRSVISPSPTMIDFDDHGDAALAIVTRS